MNQLMHSRITGIDLGTTNTLMAFLEETGRPKVVPNMDGDMLTPSVVYIGKDGKEILVGNAAHSTVRDRIVHHVSDCILHFLRFTLVLFLHLVRLALARRWLLLFLLVWLLTLRDVLRKRSMMACAPMTLRVRLLILLIS